MVQLCACLAQRLRLLWLSDVIDCFWQLAVLVCCL